MLALRYQDVEPTLKINHCLGIRKIKYAGVSRHSHGGGLGTDIIYLPELNATGAVASIEASRRPIFLEIGKGIIK